MTFTMSDVSDPLLTKSDPWLVWSVVYLCTEPLFDRFYIPLQVFNARGANFTQAGYVDQPNLDI